MRLLYSFGISCYALGVHLAAPFNTKAKQMLHGWRTTFGRLSVAPVGDTKTAWFHASSLGEFEQARPVIAAFKRQFPDCRICVTFFSPSGYEVRKNYPEADFVCYLPPDTRRNARRFLNMLHPDVAFFAKYDFWFNSLEQLRLRQVPTYLFSAIFRPNQYFFRWYGRWFHKHLNRCFTHLFIQNQESLDLLRRSGISHCSIAGDTRFDQVNDIAQHVKPFPVAEQYLARQEGRKVLLAGSSWEPDEANLKRYLDHAGGNIALILAPHVISESHLAGIEKVFGPEHCLRYSQLAADPSRDIPRILIIDNFGMLSSLYQYADIAYIGGGFGAGIHNILEAVTFGKPVVFGPNYRKFQEAHDLLRMGGAFSYSEYSGLENALDALFRDPARYRQAADTCTEYLRQNLGSTQKIISLVAERLKYLS